MSALFAAHYFVHATFYRYVSSGDQIPALMFDLNTASVVNNNIKNNSKNRNGHITNKI